MFFILNKFKIVNSEQENVIVEWLIYVHLKTELEFSVAQK